MQAAADAAIELGLAAEGFKKSWEHVKKAQAKGRPAERAAVRAGKKVVKAASHSAKRALRQVKGRK